ncbi:MAG TPA: DUF2851 family protein [Niastella sp.]|nr:DUF2851 family protein [Niastella sp.]
MTEKLLQFIWQFQYFSRANLRTIEGESLEILFPGKLNNNQGPDFLDAKLRIGTTLFAGSVELHLKTSDWSRHGHTSDSNYSNVILHVVLQHDALIKNTIPVLELQNRISVLMQDRYANLMEAASFVPCAASLTQVQELTWLSWKERLVAERLTRKAQAVFQILNRTSHHWEETFWRLLARNFGITVNAEAFEELAQSISITILAKHRNSIHQLEALLLGQSHLIPEDPEDEYTKLLQREYTFLRNKFLLKPITSPVHFLRMRPGNFPTIRLAQLAMLVHTSHHLFSKLLEETDLNVIRNWLQVTANDYWHYHYRPDHPSAYKPKKLGRSMADTVIINTIVPVLFAYGVHQGQEAHKEKALRWLQEMNSESNAVTNGFREISVSTKSAYDSQALLELKREYCDNKRCLNCAVGVALLKKCS